MFKNKQELNSFVYDFGKSCGGFYSLLCERNKIIKKDFPKIVNTKVKRKMKKSKTKEKVTVIKKKNEIITKKVIIKKPASKKVIIHKKNNFNDVVDFFKKHKMIITKDDSRSGRCYIITDKEKNEYNIRYNLTYDVMLQEIKDIDNIYHFLDTYNSISNEKKKELKLLKKQAREQAKLDKIKAKEEKRIAREKKKLVKAACKKEKEKDLTKTQKINELQKRRTDIILNIMHYTTVRGSDKHKKLRNELTEVLNELESLGVATNGKNIGAIDENTIKEAKERAKQKRKEKKELKEKAKNISGILVKDKKRKK